MIESFAPIPTLHLLYYNDVSTSTFPQGANLSSVYMWSRLLSRFVCIYDPNCHVNLTSECRGVLLVTSYMCPLRTQV